MKRKTLRPLVHLISSTMCLSAADAGDIFFKMDLSRYRDGTAWTPKISQEVFGVGASTNKFLRNGQVKIVRDPYGSRKNVLRIELRPEDFGNVITPHVNIYKHGAPANMREGTSILEVALSDTWGHGPTGIHMPFWRSKRFRAQRKPILPDVYAFFHQYCGNNSSIDARWRNAGHGGGPWRKSTIDRISCFYTYDQDSFQRLALSNLDDPSKTRASNLPIAQPVQWKTGGYVTQQAHIRLSTPGQNNGFYKGYHDGQLVFDRSNIMTLPAGQDQDLELFAFVFYVNGGDGKKGNPVQWNVPNDGMGPKYMYIRTFMLKAGGPLGG